ncbi:MAG TPA: helix-turn-helix domain-containing protein [Fimbriimonas sp.]
MIKDRVALDLPYYDGLLAGYYRKEPGYASRRASGTDDWLLVATLSGQGRFGSSVGDLAAMPGSLTLVAPGTPHDYGIARGEPVWEILWVHFQPPPAWLEYLAWPTVVPGVAQFEPPEPEWPSIQSAFYEVHRCSLDSGRRRRQRSMNALERLLLLCEELLPDAGAPLDGRIQTIVEYIHRHLNEPLSLGALSGRVHLSPSRFSHLFRAETGMSPLQYISQQRIRRASTLLERTSLGIGEVASAVGMDPIHFSSRFKSETGLNPRAYRRRALP